MNRIFNDERRIINLENINEYRQKIKGNFYNSIKSQILQLIEFSHKELLENNNLTEEDLEDITNSVVDSDELDDYINRTIRDEINNYIKENELKDEEENEI